MNWGDELCGVQVTPESWAGGGVMVERESGRYVTWSGAALRHPVDADPSEVYATYRFWDTDIRDNCDPVFPPARFAGRKDQEIWAAVWGSQMFPCAPVNIGVGGHRLDNSDCWQVGLTREGKILVSAGLIDPGHSDHGCGCTIEWQTLDDPAALILALQNAQVLAARLQEPA